MSDSGFSDFPESAGSSFDSDSAGSDPVDSDSTGSDSTASDSVEVVSADSSEVYPMGDSTEKATISEASDSSDSTAGVAADTVTTESGLKYIITRKGAGPTAKAGQVVSVHYAGRLASNGKEFDNSFKRQAPIEFPLGRGIVIKGWDEGIAGMAVGEARTLIIPGNLGYGTAGHRGAGIPPNADLIFDLELVAIK